MSNTQPLPNEVSFRVVATRKDGKEPDLFHSRDTLGLEYLFDECQKGSYGEYVRLQRQVFCPRHGWVDTFYGLCWECEDEYYEQAH